MSNPPPDVREVIDEFAERLLALASGEQIPDDWMRYLLERLAPKPKPRGRPLNRDCLEMVAYEMAGRCLENNPIVAKTSPNKNDKEKALLALPVQDKRRIAAIYRVDTRTITNMQRIVDRIFLKDPAPSLPDEKHDAVMQGVAHAIAASIKRKDEEEADRTKLGNK